MKLALLSDIHGNQYALSKVVSEIKMKKIETLIVAGDTVGYYYGIKYVLNQYAKIYFSIRNIKIKN